MKIIVLLMMSFLFLFANIGKVSALKGDANIQRGKDNIVVKIGSILEKNDTISTKENAKVQIIFEDNTIITLGKNSALNINDYVYDTKTPKNSKTDFNFFKGAFKTISGNIGKINREKFKLKTKSATMGIRGTIILGNQRVIACTSGQIVVESNDKQVVVNENQMTFTKEGAEPTAPQEMTVEDLESLENGTEDEDTTNNDENKEENEKDSISSSVEENSNDNTKDESLEKEENTFSSSNRKMKGKIYTSDEQSNDISKGDLSATRNSNTITFDTNLNSSSIQYDNFDKIRKGSYSDFSKIENHSIGNYVIYTDNMGQVVVGLEEEANKLFMIGSSSNLKKIDKNNIYVYKNLAQLQVNNNEVSSTLFQASEETQYLFYNPYLDSLTVINKDLQSKGAKDFYVGSDDELKYYYSENFVDQTSTRKTIRTDDSSISFKGIDYQGVFSEISGKQHTDDFSTTPTENSYEDIQAFTKIDKSYTIKNSGTLDLNGYLVGKNAGGNISNDDFYTSKDFNLKIDRSTGEFSSDGFNFNLENEEGVATDIKFDIDSKVSDDNAYYINDDIFGTFFDEDSSFYNRLNNDSNPTLKMVENTGVLLTIPDGVYNSSDDVVLLFDENDNPLMNDDESSWGYWSASFEKESDINPAFINSYSTWVAGTQTSESIVQNAINSNKKYNFYGKVIGSVYNGSTHEVIKQDNTNLVKLKFDLGAGTNAMNGSNIKFESSSTKWDVNLTSSSISTTKFNADLETATSKLYTPANSGTAITDLTGKIEGKYFGTEDIKSVGGTFNFSGNSNQINASGVFKATKK